MKKNEYYKEGTKDGNITIHCPYKSGIFKNGHIHSFIGIDESSDHEGAFTANKDCTCYGPYYDGIDWGTNFVELFTDPNLKIYSVIDKKGRKYKIGDDAPNVFGEGKLKITSFYVHCGEIQYRGIEIKQSMGSFPTPLKVIVKGTKPKVLPCRVCGFKLGPEDAIEGERDDNYVLCGDHECRKKDREQEDDEE